MAIQARRIVLNIQPNTQITARVNISQYDVGVPIEFELMDGDLVASLPSGATAKVHGTRPSGVGFSQACTINDNILTVYSTTSMSGEAGQIPAEVVIEYSGDVIGTANFFLNVERSPHKDGTIDSDIIIQAGLVERVETLEDEVDQNTGDITDLEGEVSDLKEDKADLISYDNEPLGELQLGIFQTGVIQTSKQCACDDSLHDIKTEPLFINVEDGYKVFVYWFYNSTYTGVWHSYTEDVTIPFTAQRNVKLAFGHADDSLLTSDEQADLEAFVNAHFKVYRSSKHVVYSDELEAVTDDTLVVPEYWRTTLNTKESTIMSLQDSGINAFSFAFISDIHWGNNNKVSPALINDIRVKCNVPILVNGGDLTGGNSVEKSAIKAELLEVCETLNKIPMTRLTCVGNHDDNSISTLYAKTLNNNEKYNYIERYTEDYIDLIQYGETGTYYYLDDIAHKVRYIVTDCYNLIYQDDGNGGLVYSSMTSGGLGVYRQEQIDWFANVALDVPTDDWSVIVFSHNPPNQGIIVNDYLMMGVLEAFNNKSDWSAASLPSVTDPNYICTITVNYIGKGGNVIGWFAGHQHTDKFVTSTYSYPIIVTTCDTMTTDKTAGTTTEQAFDVVTVNKSTKAINLTRIGAGADRNTTY